jgi:hypothetical protein
MGGALGDQIPGLAFGVHGVRELLAAACHLGTRQLLLQPADAHDGVDAATAHWCTIASCAVAMSWAVANEFEPMVHL